MVNKDDVVSVFSLGHRVLTLIINIVVIVAKLIIRSDSSDNS